MSASTVAVIDIGSNSIKALIARRTAQGPIEAVAMRTIDARISAGISKSEPRLGEEGMLRGVEAVRDLLALAAPHRPEHTVIVATSAVRDAVNGQEFRDRVQAATGHTIRILGGDEEADFIGRGLTCDPALGDLRDFYVFDLGGGSLECLTFRDRRIAQSLSLRLGCVRTTEQFIPDPLAPIPRSACVDLARHVRDTLKSSGFRFSLGEDAAAVFAGGSMTTVRAIRGAAHGLTMEDTPPVVSLEALGFLLDEIAPLDLDQRRAIPGMPPARADVFPAALITMIALAEFGLIHRFHHSLYNLRWGMAAELLANSR